MNTLTLSLLLFAFTFVNATKPEFAEIMKKLHEIPTTKNHSQIMAGWKFMEEPGFMYHQKIFDQSIYNENDYVLDETCKKDYETVQNDTLEERNYALKSKQVFFTI